MQNIQDLPKPARERIEELKAKSPLAEEELSFLMARRDYLTEEEKERIFKKEEVTEEVKEVKKRGRPSRSSKE
mgnify:FL=1